MAPYELIPKENITQGLALCLAPGISPKEIKTLGLNAVSQFMNGVPIAMNKNQTFTVVGMSGRIWPVVAKGCTETACGLQVLTPYPEINLKTPYAKDIITEGFTWTPQMALVYNIPIAVRQIDLEQSVINEPGVNNLLVTMLNEAAEHYITYGGVSPVAIKTRDQIIDLLGMKDSRGEVVGITGRKEGTFTIQVRPRRTLGKVAVAQFPVSTNFPEKVVMNQMLSLYFPTK